jgi:hypothetical protein
LQDLWTTSAAGAGIPPAPAGYNLRHTPSGPTRRHGSLAVGDGDGDGDVGVGERDAVGGDETGPNEPEGCDDGAEEADVEAEAVGAADGDGDGEPPGERAGRGDRDDPPDPGWPLGAGPARLPIRPGAAGCAGRGW